MKVVNLDTVTVATTAGGTEIFSAAQARVATSEGMRYVSVNPTVAISMVDAGGLIVTSQIPNLAGTGLGAVAGTVANSPLICPAGTTTMIEHRSGPLRAIAASSSTVQIAVVEVP